MRLLIAGMVIAVFAGAVRKATLLFVEGEIPLFGSSVQTLFCYSLGLLVNNRCLVMKIIKGDIKIYRFGS